MTGKKGVKKKGPKGENESPTENPFKILNPFDTIKK